GLLRETQLPSRIYWELKNSITTNRGAGISAWIILRMAVAPRLVGPAKLWVRHVKGKS
ncbi:unnamed protein product, partial [Ascophyllum nodosum]